MAADRVARREKGQCLYSVVAEEQPIALDEQNQTMRRSVVKDVKVIAR